MFEIAINACRSSDPAPTDDAAMRKRGVCLITLALGLGTLSACSQPASIPEDTAVRGSANALAPAPKPAAAQVASRVIGTKDKTLSDGKVCEVSFVYGGREPESIFWEEPCAGVTAKMMDRRELEQLGRWERLDDFERKFVEGMPGGKVLYVGGDASASIYPIGTTGTSYEVAVAD